MSSMCAWFGWRTWTEGRMLTLKNRGTQNRRKNVDIEKQENLNRRENVDLRNNWESPFHRFWGTFHKPQVSGQPPQVLRLQRQPSRSQCPGIPEETHWAPLLFFANQCCDCNFLVLMRSNLRCLHSTLVAYPSGGAVWWELIIHLHLTLRLPPT